MLKAGFLDPWAKKVLTVYHVLKNRNLLLLFFSPRQGHWAWKAFLEIHSLVRTFLIFPSLKYEFGFQFGSVNWFCVLTKPFRLSKQLGCYLFFKPITRKG